MRRARRQGVFDRRDRPSDVLDTGRERPRDLLDPRRPSTSPSACPDHRAKSVEETTSSSVGNAERDPHPAIAGTARPGLALTPTIVGRSHGRLRLALHQEAQLPTLNSRSNSTTAAAPSQQNENRPVFTPPGTCIANHASPRAPLASQRLQNWSQALKAIRVQLNRTDLIGQLLPYMQNTFSRTSIILHL